MLNLTTLFIVLSLLNLALLYPVLRSLKFEEKLKNPYNDLDKNLGFHLALLLLATLPVFNIFFCLSASILLFRNRRFFATIRDNPEIAVLYRLEKCFDLIHQISPEAKVNGSSLPDFTWKRKSSVVLSFLKKHQKRADISALLVRSENVINHNLKNLSLAPLEPTVRTQASNAARSSLEPFIEEVRLLYISEPSILAKYIEHMKNKPTELQPVSVSTPTRANRTQFRRHRRF